MQDKVTGELKPISAERYVEERRRGVECVLRRGEVIELRGGRFRVAAIGRKFVRLEGLPGTRVGG